MTIEQTVAVPDDYRLSLELPRSIPTGVMVRVKIDIPAVCTKNIQNSTCQFPFAIESVRQVLQKEMTDNGTWSATAASGEGWEAYVKERYAES